ncbi:MAG: fibronectin type III domain-containing protein, partial [Terrimicrobiaceae bacterium]
TNGYISLDNGQSTFTISSTVDRVLGILPADLEMNSVRWASSSTRFYVFWRGKRFSGGTDFEIEYEVHFIDGQDYALIKLISFPTSTYSTTAYYVDGSRTGYSAITSRAVGGEYRVYFGTDAAFATSFTEFGTSTDPVWLASGSVTSGTNDDGYFSIVANQGASSQAPTSVTASSITNTTATVSWTAPARESRGMSAIQSYDYSLNSGSSWTSTSANTSVNLTGLTANTSYTVLVRANNYYFTGTNYGSVTFSTTNLTVPNAVTGLSSTAISGGARISWGAPSSDGGSAITRYEVKRDSFAYFSVGLSTSYDYTLSPGTYTIYVRAVNAIGNGAESSISVTVAAPPASVTLIFGYTGGRIANNNWANPKATMDYYLSNVTSMTARIQRSSDNSTWTSGATESLSVSGGYASQSTNQPVGTTNASGNFWYRAQVISLNGITLSPTITSASFQNTATAKSAQLYP